MREALRGLASATRSRSTDRPYMRLLARERRAQPRRTGARPARRRELRRAARGARAHTDTEKEEDPVAETTVRTQTRRRPAAQRRAATSIEVENPATGEVIAGPVARCPADVARDGRARAAPRSRPGRRSASRAAAGPAARAEVDLDNSRPRDRHDRLRDRQDLRGRPDRPRSATAAAAFGFWAKNAAKYLATSACAPARRSLLGQEARGALPPARRGRRDRPLELPAHELVRRLHPGAGGRQLGVLKPSEITPLTSLLMAEMLRRVRPAGGRLPGGSPACGDVGAELIDHVDFVMFTGSTATGKKVAARAAATLTPVGLELGGKDPMIVLRDADLEKAANAATYYSMQNGGQTCISVERVYVEEPVYDEFVKLVTEKIGKLRQGVPAGPGSVDVGAVTFAPQAEIVDAHVEDAVAKGATVAVGGHLKEGPRPLLRADAAAGRRPHDAVHDRGDVRPDAAGHEGGGRGRGGAAGERLPVRPPGVGLDQGHRPRRGDRRPDRGGACERQRAPAELLRARAPMGGWKSRAWAPATAPTASASTPASRSRWSRASARSGSCSCSPTPSGARGCSGALKLLHGRGKR